MDIARRRFGLLFSSLGERPTASTASTVAAPLAVPLAALRMPVRMVLDCGCADEEDPGGRGGAFGTYKCRMRVSGQPGSVDTSGMARDARRVHTSTRRDETRQRPMIREHG